MPLSSVVVDVAAFLRIQTAASSILFDDHTSFSYRPYRSYRQSKIAAAKFTDHLPTLTDTFGRHHTYLRISLTERCNLRCKCTQQPID